MEIGYINKINMLINDKRGIERFIIKIEKLTFKDFEHKNCIINDFEMHNIIEQIGLNKTESHLDTFKTLLIESLKEKLEEIEKELNTYTITKQ